MNLLVDPLLRVQTARGLEHMSLPALLAALGRDEVEHLPGLQRHQEDAFHVFLCCLAGAILSRRGDSDPVQPEEYWRSGLRGLAGEAGDDAWTLVVADVSRPAFMQPPLTMTKFTVETDFPDVIDALQTAKNHDVKTSRMQRPETDHWVYALVSGHLNAGYSKGGATGFYFPTVKVASNYSGRVYVYAAPPGGFGVRWRYCTQRVAEERRRLLDDGTWPYRHNGLVLTWLRPWDGTESIHLNELDPAFIEVTRAVRLSLVDGRIQARCSPTRVSRIGVPRQLGGNVGDPWIPVDLQTGSVWAVGEAGWRARRVRQLLFGEGVHCTTLQWPSKPGETPLVLRCVSLTRSRRGTEGYQEYTVTIPATVQRRLWSRDPHRERLSKLSRDAIDYADTMQSGVLKPAVLTLLTGDSEKHKLGPNSVKEGWTRFAKLFEALWSDDFFPWLWSVPDSFDHETELKRWAVQLRGHALTVMGEAEHAAPQRAARRYRVRVQADRTFWGALHRNFPFLKGERYEHGAED